MYLHGVEEFEMDHQGNLTLGYDIAIVVRVSKSFRNQVSKLIDRTTVEDCIIDEVLKHLNTRFNKGNENAIKVILKATVANKVIVRWYDVNDLSECKSAAKHIRNKIGTAYIMLFDSEPQEHLKLEDELKPALRSVNPKIHVEFFHIDLPHNVKLEDEKRISDVLYHLASRISAAFVEYIPVFSVLTKSRESYFIKALDIPKEKEPVRKECDVIKKILDVRDAIDLICEGLDGSMHFFPPVPRHMNHIFEGKDLDENKVKVRYKFPFGVWFRGQAKICYDLQPSLFREQTPLSIHRNCAKNKNQNIMYDESSMVNHFVLTKPEFRNKYQDMFEWLCLMQHYNAPSRVLDWTENILMALFFAVHDANNDCDGAVWVLNAGRLNEHTRVVGAGRYACLPNSTDVILRSAMAVSRTGKEMKTTLIKQNHWELIHNTVRNDDVFFDWLEGGNGKESIVWNKLAKPLAVFPACLNDRQANQQATFTLHGGKSYDPEIRSIPNEERCPNPESLIELSKDSVNNNYGKRFLDVYLVPSCAKRKLREQLHRIGINIASVYPELEYQGQFIRNQWRFEPKHD